MSSPDTRARGGPRSYCSQARCGAGVSRVLSFSMPLQQFISYVFCFVLFVECMIIYRKTVIFNIFFKDGNISFKNPSQASYSATTTEFFFPLLEHQIFAEPIFSSPPIISTRCLTAIPEGPIFAPPQKKTDLTGKGPI